MKRKHSKSTFWSVAVLVAAAFCSGCLGATRPMQPTVSAASTAGEVATSCAGDVCFHYSGDSK